VLRTHELSAAWQYCRAAGAEGVMAGARLSDLIAGRSASGEVWAVAKDRRRFGRFQASDITALCWRGANLMPVGVAPDQVGAFVHLAKSRGGRPVSIVGSAPAVLTFFGQLKGVWGKARQVWPNQLLMELAGRPLVAPDPLVKPAKANQVDYVAPAAVAMFTEELGFEPPDPEGVYRLRVSQMVHRGAVFVRTAADGKSIEFKADLAAVVAEHAQVQGVWTRPDKRGQGLAKAGMAAVVQAAARRGIRAVSLYVNEFNRPAVAAYQAVGFRQIGTFATVMY